MAHLFENVQYLCSINFGGLFCRNLQNFNWTRFAVCNNGQATNWGMEFVISGAYGAWPYPMG